MLSMVSGVVQCKLRNGHLQRCLMQPCFVWAWVRPVALREWPGTKIIGLTAIKYNTDLYYDCLNNQIDL